jgi:hypothetical protein
MFGDAKADVRRAQRNSFVSNLYHRQQLNQRANVGALIWNAAFLLAPASVRAHS